MYELVDRESMEFQLEDVKTKSKHKPNLDKIISLDRKLVANDRKICKSCIQHSA
jgi:hypothetical protein